MPNIKSAKKKMRKDKKKTLRNQTYLSLVEKTVKKLFKIKDGAEKTNEIKKAESLIDKAAKKNIIHKNKAARLKSRIMKVSLKK